MSTLASLCSGYGGLDDAVAAVFGTETIWHAENDPDASLVLAKRWPGMPNLGDITRADWSTVEPPRVLAMGVPCQPASAAGRQLAEADPRWLWPYALRAIRALTPPIVVFENVRNLISLRKGEVWRTMLDEWRAAGYLVRWCVVGACAIGACHHRHRVFALGVHVGFDGGATRVATPECADRADTLLPTPTHRDGSNRGPGTPAYWAARTHRTEGMPLDATISLLPENFGRFAGAVARQASWFGPPPEPTAPNRNGAPRLRAEFAEWMMGLPAGLVTDHLPRVPALARIGNGVMPQQAIHALNVLMSRS